MLIECQSLYLKDLEKTKSTIFKSVIKTKEYFPRYVIKREFFSSSEEDLKRSISSRSRQIFKFSNYQEYRILTLIQCLDKAKRKFKSDFEEDSSMMEIERNNNLSGATSALVLVNNIIKNSYESTTLVFLLEWLHKIYSKDSFEREKFKGRTFFEGTSDLLKSEGKKFHPDLFNSNEAHLSESEAENYNKLLEMILILIRQGKLDEAQRTAEYYDQSFLSAMLCGGLPMNDLILDNFETLKKLDWELFPPFMKTKDFYNIKARTQTFNDVPTEYENVYEITDNVVGNPDWGLWLSSSYTICDKSDCDWRTRLIMTYISGNPSFIEKNNYPVYDLMYTHLVHKLNSKVCEEFSNHPITDYHFSQSDKLDFYRHGKVEGITSLLSLIKSTDEYKAAVKKDFLIEFETGLILLHSLENSLVCDVSYYKALEDLLENFVKTFHDNPEFEEYLRTHYNLICSLEGEEPRLSRAENDIQANKIIELVRLNYFKIIFETLISFYSTNTSKFKVDVDSDQSIKDTMSNIYKNFDTLISIYFQMYTKFILDSNVNLKPEHVVYILCFLLDVHSVQANLTFLAQSLEGLGEENYKSLVKEIEIHFSEYRENLTTNIANNTNIYLVDSLVASVDDILHRELNDNITISKDDQCKINQISLLFIEGELDTLTVLKFMLKLSLKFLSNNKFTEAKILENEFEEKLNVVNILGKRLVTERSLQIEELNFVFILEQNLDYLYNMMSNYDIEISHFGIYYTVLLVKWINRCYFQYKDLVKCVFSSGEKGKLAPNEYMQKFINEKKESLIKYFKNTMRLFRVIVTNDEIREVIINFFGEEIYHNEIKTIISNWIFQVLKWTSDLFTLETFRGLMTEDGLSLILDYLNLDEDFLLKNYLLDHNEKFLDIERSFFSFYSESQEKRKEIYGFINKLKFCSKNMISEVFDDEFDQKINDDLENFEF